MVLTVGNRSESGNNSKTDSSSTIRMKKMAKCIPDTKNDCRLQKSNQDVRLDCVNYCVTGLMSRCSAGTVWNDQKRCKFAEKSTVSNRCMHFIEAIDGHCDCVEAQRELSKAVNVKADKP